MCEERLENAINNTEIFKVKKNFPVLNYGQRFENVFRKRGIAPQILRQGARWRCVTNCTPRPLGPQVMSLWRVLDRRLGQTVWRLWTQNQPLPLRDPKHQIPRHACQLLTY